MFWVISVYFNLRNTLLKFGTFLLGHPVYIYCSFVINFDEIFIRFFFLRCLFVKWSTQTFLLWLGGCFRQCVKSDRKMYFSQNWSKKEWSCSSMVAWDPSQLKLTGQAYAAVLDTDRNRNRNRNRCAKQLCHSIILQLVYISSHVS